MVLWVSPVNFRSRLTNSVLTCFISFLSPSPFLNSYFVTPPLRWRHLRGNGLSRKCPETWKNSEFLPRSWDLEEQVPAIETCFMSIDELLVARILSKSRSPYIRGVLNFECTFIKNKAKWHKSCSLKYNSTKLDAAKVTAQKCEETDASSSMSSISTRSYMKSVDTLSNVCFLCTGNSTGNNSLRKVCTLKMDLKGEEKCYSISRHIVASNS